MNILSIDKNGNKIVGHYPICIESSLNFNGHNNILYCEENVTLDKSILDFNGENSLIYLGTSKHKINVSIFNDSVCHCGRFNSYTGPVKIILSEQKHCFIGNHGLFSVDVMIRNSDAHLIYSCEDGNRISQSKSVYIGDHVLVGQQVTILKNSQIDSGSIIGTGSVVAGKKIPHNSIWAGNPASQVKDKIFWDKTCVHGFTNETTESSMNYHKFITQNREGFHDDHWVFEYNKNQVIEWEYIESALSYGTSEEKCVFLIQLNSDVKFDKNRFAHDV